MNIYTAIDRTPYTYVITHIPSGKKYYGSRYKKWCLPDDLWSSYFTSSNTIHELIKKNTLAEFHYEIRKIFNSIKECRSWEFRVLHKLHANTNDKWLNKHNGGKEFFNAAPASEKTKEKMSKVRLGKPKSKTMKQNAMWYYELKFLTGKTEYIKGKINVLTRLGRKDWETIRNCIKNNNGFVPRAKVFVQRMAKSFIPE
jgi:hypothetical protein